MNILNQKINQNVDKILNICILLIMVIGALLRIFYFATDRSLWLDEAMLALNITTKNYTDFLSPLDYNQAAPPLFLIAEKICSDIAPRSDLALRTVPLCASLLSIYVFWILSKRVLSHGFGVAATALFCFTPALVRYSTEVKQYTTDLLLCLIILLVALNVIYEYGDKRYWVWLTLIGLISPWASHSSVFILATVGLVGFAWFIYHHNQKNLLYLFLVGMIWFIGMLIYYQVSLKGIRQNDVLDTFWQNYFLLPGDPKANLNLLKNMVLDVLGIKPIIFAIALMVFGLWNFIRRRWEIFLLLVLPIIITFIASGFHLYPFYNRFLLFLAPSLILITISGVEYLIRIFTKLTRNKINIIILFALLFGVFAHPIEASYSNLITPNKREDIKPVLQGIKDNLQPGDVIFVYYGAEPAFRYYAPYYDLWAPESILIGTKSLTGPDKYIRELEPLRERKRVWMIFSHNVVRSGTNEEAYILNCLGGSEKALRSFQAQDSRAYLYDFSTMLCSSLN